MAYPYGTQNGPAQASLSAPGLPRKGGNIGGADPTGMPTQYLIVRANQMVRVPSWATYARLGATGAGGQGYIGNSAFSCGGGAGGGFAGTNVLKVNPGQPINVSFTSAGTVVEGLGYALIAGNGTNGGNNTSNAPGGTATGGDVNFSGGAGGAATAAGCSGGGGGAAGRGGNGSQGGNATGSSTTNNGGRGASGADHIGGASGGGSGFYYGSTSAAGQIGSNAAQSMGSGLINVGMTSTPYAYYGGDGGGGAGGYSDAAAPTNPPVPGAGFAIIEFW